MGKEMGESHTSATEGEREREREVRLKDQKEGVREGGGVCCHPKGDATLEARRRREEIQAETRGG